MKNYRIFVEKHPRFRVEAESLRRELNANLNLDIRELRLLNVYDLFGFSEELLEKTRYSVFGEVVTDSVTDACDLAGQKYIAVEYLPGQFDQRAASAVDCVRLIDPSAEVRIRSSKLLLFDGAVTDEEIARIKRYYINAVESREKDLSVLSDMEQAEVKPVAVLEGFTKMTDAELAPDRAQYGLAMNADDLREVVKYFRAEGRDPYETELRILDTYWSDHCRHTTFTTELEGITVEESFVKDEIEDSLALYLRIRRELGREHKSICLMDMATIGARYLRKKGLLDDMEVSDENNACSVYVDVDVDGRTEKWLLQFKNETHNHPTEIEPFGGASTCLGGAIRDPLSGRSYVYQAMRVTGAGDIYQKVGDTLEGKLPQSVISKKAAAGYSSYGNQIGLATTHVREVYHDGYVAKRLEVGAVVGAVKAENVRREKPRSGRQDHHAGRPYGPRRHRRSYRIVERAQHQVAGDLRQRGAEGQCSGGAQARTSVPPSGGDAAHQEIERLRRGRRQRRHRRAGRRAGHLPRPREDQVQRPELHGAGHQRVAGAHGGSRRSEGRRDVHVLLSRREYRSRRGGRCDRHGPYADVQQGPQGRGPLARIHRQRRRPALCRSEGRRGGKPQSVRT